MHRFSSAGVEIFIQYGFDVDKMYIADNRFIIFFFKIWPHGKPRWIPMARSKMFKDPPVSLNFKFNKC